MRRLTSFISITTSIMLFLQYNAQAQTHNNNLHETVTHRPDGSAKVEGVKNKNNTAAITFNRLSQENTMPQNNEFGYWSGYVTVFHQYITERLPQLDRDGMIHGMPFSTYNYKQWTKDDLRILATAYNGVETFEILTLLKDAAGAKAPTDKLSAQDILDAQRALEALKPDNISWKKFGNWIIEVEQATETQRAAMHKKKENAKGKSGALLELGKFDNIAGDPMDGLDQQKALELLDKNAVKMDSDHSLKSPDPKAIALDIVKSIKGAVRAA